MRDAIIHNKRKDSASIYFATQSEAGNAEVALQQAKKGLKVTSRAENVTSALE